MSFRGVSRSGGDSLSQWSSTPCQSSRGAVQGTVEIDGEERISTSTRHRRQAALYTKRTLRLSRCPGLLMVAQPSIDHSHRLPDRDLVDDPFPVQARVCCDPVARAG